MENAGQEFRATKDLDIGFTEGTIWISKAGYGYFFDDEPRNYYRAARIPGEKWKRILKVAWKEPIIMNIES